MAAQKRDDKTIRWDEMRYRQLLHQLSVIGLSAFRLS
jgi:hypothetical protein